MTKKAMLIENNQKQFIEKLPQKKMKIIALVGAAGTGKTTIIEKIKKLKPDWIFLSEATRRTVPILGYSNPWDIVKEFGISFYEAMIISQWCIIDPVANPFLKENAVCVVDRSPLDNLAYYYLERQENEYQHELVLKSLCKHFASFIDLYLFFPIGAFPISNDDMRLENTNYQKKYDRVLSDLLKETNQKVHIITSKSVEERVEEVLMSIDNIEKL